MKNSGIIILVSLLVCADAPAQDWVYTGGLGSGGISAIVVTSEGTLVATNRNHSPSYISISNDTGKNWIPVTGETTPNASWLVIDSNKDIIGGNYRSTDNGKTWSTINNRPAPIDLLHVCLVHQNGTIFLITGDSGLYRSTDNGITWSRIGFYDLKAINLDASGTLYVMEPFSYQNYISTDNGLNWFGDSHHDYGIVSLTSNLYGDIYAAGDSTNELEISSDKGNTWSIFNKGINSTHINGLVTAPDGTVFAYTGTGIFKRSVDDCSWLPFSEGLLTKSILCMTFDKEGRLYAGSNGGDVFKSLQLFNKAPTLTGRLLASDLDFGTVNIGDTECENLTITNIGPAPITLTKDFIVVDPMPFSVASHNFFPITLQPHDGVSIEVCFHPPQPAVYASEIVWKTNITASDCALVKPQSFLHGVAAIKSSIPLEKNEIIFSIYPNPIHEKADIHFSLASASYVKIECFDMLGRSRKILTEGDYEAGNNFLSWGTSNLTVGAYIIQYTVGTIRLSQSVSIAH